MIHLDGSQGEGGGQILRTALGLSLVTGVPFRMEKVRAGREKPGLLRQHLTAVNAAVSVGAAEVEGATLGSRELTFWPGKPHPVGGGEFTFAVGTAGSAGLVLQTVLPALLTAKGPSRLTLEGGTHNPFAPPFNFLARAFLPLVNRMGPGVTATLVRPGFYPAGGGKLEVLVEPCPRLQPLELMQRGKPRTRSARALIAGLARGIATRELAIVRERLGWTEEQCEVDELPTACGPGNALILEVVNEHVTEIFSGFGQRGVAAERVATQVSQEVRDYLAAPGAPAAGEHLADQLLIPLALAGGGAFSTVSPSRHTVTNVETIIRFLPHIRFELREPSSDDQAWAVVVGA